LVARHRPTRALVVGGPAVAPGQGRRCPAFIHADQLAHVVASQRCSPLRPRRFVPLACCQRLFVCVQPNRCSARHIVATLTTSPCCSAHHEHSSASVASGHASSRARSYASSYPPIPPGPPGIRLRFTLPVFFCWTI